MRLRARHGERLVFALGKRQAARLRETLALYPALPAGYHKISRHGDPAQLAAEQQLLDQSLAEQRTARRRELEAFLADPAQLREHAGTSELWITPAQADWLLQILNDIRVGSWAQLGCPDPARLRRLGVTPKTAPQFIAILVCEEFIGPLLEALHS